MERATERDGVDLTTVTLIITGNDDTGAQLVFVDVAKLLKKGSGDLGCWGFGVFNAKKSDMSDSCRSFDCQVGVGKKKETRTYLYICKW